MDNQSQEDESVEMNQDETELILHTMKAIADSQRREVKYRNDMLDMMCKELNIEIPCRRENGERRNEKTN